MHRSTQHIALYQKPSRYAGCPVNYGIWSWQEEIVGGFHTTDRNRPFLTDQRRRAFIVSYQEATEQRSNGAQWHILRAA